MSEIPAKIANQVAVLTPCHIWYGLIGTDGYGRLYHAGKPYLAHRFFYKMLISDIPDDMVLDHLCMNKRCVNPEHLEVVTRSENSSRISRRSMRKQCAALRNAAKLSESQS